MIDDDRVDDARVPHGRMIAADLDRQAAAIAAHGTHSLVERDARVGLVERPRVRHHVQPADIDTDGAFGSDDLEPGARTRQHLGRRHRRVRAIVVVQQHVAAEPGVAADHVPRGHDEIGT